MKKNKYLQILEDLPARGGMPMPEEICNGFAELTQYDQIAYARALKFIGCADVKIIEAENDFVVQQTDRVCAARVMLLQLHVGEKDPRWSSWIIDRLWDAVLGVPGATFSDLFQALFDLFVEYNYELNSQTANFIRAITYNGRIGAFSKYKNLYSSENFGWMVEKAGEELTPPTGYLLFYSAPSTFFPVKLAFAILKSLVGTSFWQALSGSIINELNNSEGRALLDHWIVQDEGMVHRAEIIEFLSQSSK